jgi:hypothetical protein
VEKRRFEIARQIKKIFISSAMFFCFFYCNTIDSVEYFHVTEFDPESPSIVEDSYARSTEDAVYQINSVGDESLLFQAGPTGTTWYNYDEEDGEGLYYRFYEIVDDNATVNFELCHEPMTGAYKIRKTQKCKDLEQTDCSPGHQFEWIVPNVGWVKAYEWTDSGDWYLIELCEILIPYEGDLLYTPVTPCRIVDTRRVGGAMPPGSIRSFNVRGAVASQGGNPAGCPSPEGEPHGVQVNVTAAPVTGSGNIRIFSFGSTPPNASLVNFKTGVQNIANSGAIKTCFNCAKDISIQSNFGTAHVVIDVMEYLNPAP